MMGVRKHPRIVIVGAGYELAVAAFALAKNLQMENTAIIAVDVGTEDQSKLVPTLSELRVFIEALGLDEKSFLSGTGADVNFGFKMITGHNSEGFLFTDSPYGMTLQNTHFHQLFHLYKQQYPDAHLDDFCLSARLARSGKFAPISDQKDSVFSAISYGYAFESRACEFYFKRLALQHNVTFIKSCDFSVVEDERGIEKIITKPGQVLEADLFIDCSERRCLISKMSHAKDYLDIDASWLPPYRHVVNCIECSDNESSLNAEIVEEATGYSKIITHGHLRSHESFEFPIRGSESGLVDPVVLGCSWTKNCVAIGSAFANLPDLLPGSYHLFQKQLLLLLDLWAGHLPSAQVPPEEKPIFAIAEIFNQACRQRVSNIIDMINIQLVSHPTLSSQIKLTETNRRRIELFTSSGSLYATENSVISDQQWVALLVALGFQQEAVNLQASGVAPGEAVEQLDSLRTLIHRTADTAPDYDEWINRGALK